MTDLLTRCRDAIRAGFTRVPLTREVVLDGDTPVSAFAKVHHGDYGFLLESLEGGERWARYSFLATEPEVVFRYRGTYAEQRRSDGGWELLSESLPPLAHLSDLLRRDRAMPVDGLPRFTGGAVGFWGYDVVRGIESLPDAPPDDRDLPDAVAMVVDTLLVLDNLYHRAIVIGNVAVAADLDDAELLRRIATVEARMGAWIDRLATPGGLAPLTPRDVIAAPANSPYADEAYRRDVGRCKEYIAAGDAFQIVLSRRMDVTPAPDPFHNRATCSRSIRCRPAALSCPVSLPIR